LPISRQLFSPSSTPNFFAAASIRFHAETAERSAAGVKRRRSSA
jgi:hypothetical protein